MLKKASYLVVLSFISLSVILPGAISHADDDAYRARQLQLQGDILPLEKIIELAATFKSGQILETDLERDDGRYVYELEILDNKGQVWEVELDARTGELIELENED
ncbi:PepSY domain-containing protein [Methylophaga sp.]|uniref:PepSY domain-containing protein n=1 Tax=Methylophaga sp. TaxID=2024840 RepID=UPI003F69D33D